VDQTLFLRDMRAVAVGVAVGDVSVVVVAITAPLEAAEVNERPH